MVQEAPKEKPTYRILKLKRYLQIQTDMVLSPLNRLGTAKHFRCDPDVEQCWQYWRICGGSERFAKENEAILTQLGIIEKIPEKTPAQRLALQIIAEGSYGFGVGEIVGHVA